MNIARLVPARFLPGLAVANLVANIGIVVTGGVVRLTGSGLGCPTWPRCTEESYVAHGELGINGAIEFGNRLLTWVLAAVAVACWLAALAYRAEQRASGRRTVVLSTVIALGVPAQALVGGITVLTDLNPWVVGFHLLVSMAIIGVCVWLLDVVRRPEGWASDDRGPRVAPKIAALSWLVYAVGWVVLYLGTVVTGSGPHAGDLDARRTGLDPQVFSHVHAFAVYVLVAFTLGLMVVAHRAGERELFVAVGALFAIELGQGVVGFVQYFTDLPIALVGLHMLGASLTAAAMAWVVVRSRVRGDAVSR